MAMADIQHSIREGESGEGRPFGAARPRASSRIVIFMSLALLAWSIVEVVGLAGRHTTGPELYGVLVAVLAVGAASLALFGMRATRWQAWIAIAVAVTWAIVAIGGIAGVAAHVVGPLPGEGPIDLRARPVLAPLAFTAMGVVGEIVLWLWWRQPARSSGLTQKGVAQ
jgi:hypothetical protein